MSDVLINRDVERALAERSPVVALESAVTTTGLPRTPHAPPVVDDPSLISALKQWRSDQPVNLETALAMSRIVQQTGATPAVVAVFDGALRIGLTNTELETFARNEHAQKCAAADLASCMARRASAGTTVSATLTACRLTTPPIRVFATGGLGGVHRNWTTHPDISTDLTALARTPVCVVCSGAKSLLDLPATLETLETLGIPVVGFRTDHLPQFIAGIRDDLPLRQHVDDVDTIIELCRVHWNVLHQESAIIIANPVPTAHALDSQEIDHAVARAEQDATTEGVSGAARTPFVLDHVARSTDGRALASNIALLLNNAHLAAKIAGSWAQSDI